jgi:hypothetical protein
MINIVTPNLKSKRNPQSHGINIVAPTNLEDFFASKVTSPRVAVLELSIFS